MGKQLFILLSSLFLVKNTNIAQVNGILPISGIRYFKEGIWAKAILVKIDGDQLVSNRLPLNKEIEILLQQPTGFIADKKKIVYAAAEFILVGPKGDIILKNPNLFLNNETTGFAPKDFKALSLKFGISEDLVKYNSTCIIKIRMYDLKGKNQLRLEFPVNIIRYSEVVQVSKSVIAIKSAAGSTGMISGVKAKSMRVFVDTSIKISPKIAYASLEISNIEGTSIGGIFGGKEIFWVYDANLNELLITDILLKEVGGAMENNLINYVLKIPFRFKTARTKGYIVRFRWESRDKTQVIDVVITI